MAATAVPGGRSLLGSLSRVGLRRPSWAPRARRAAAWCGAQLREHVLTVAALAALDLGAFDASRIAGWMVMCPCLLVLDFKLRG